MIVTGLPNACDKAAAGVDIVGALGKRNPPPLF